MTNPFLTTGYAGPEYFCDRKKETEDLISALDNGRDVTLISPRRIGKTGLIKNAFHEIGMTHKDAACFYIDIFGTQNQYEFVRTFSKAVVGKLDSFSESALKKVMQFVKKLRPVIQNDEITGNPLITVDIVPEQSEETLEQIFNYLNHSEKTCYVAFDEFQQIATYPEKGLEAKLRSYIQFLPNVHFIFAGSKMHLIEEMFASAKRPFYQSTQKMHLGVIGKEKYYEFAADKFKDAGKELPEDVFDTIYNSFDGYTWYIQTILNRLFAEKADKVTIETVKQIIANCVEEEQYTYQRYCQFASANQRALLIAIAHEKIVKEINASSFIKKYDLKAASSVNVALKWLIDNEFVLDSEDGYRIYDRFFQIWLNRL